jgi:hypothetical protein
VLILDVEDDDIDYRELLPETFVNMLESTLWYKQMKQDERAILWITCFTAYFQGRKDGQKHGVLVN